MINDRIVLNVQQPPFYKKEYIYKNEQMVWNAFNTLTDENGISLANGLPLGQQEMENILTALGENGTKSFSSGNGTFPDWAKIGDPSNGDIWGFANTSNIGAIRYNTNGNEDPNPFVGTPENIQSIKEECRADKAANLINKDVWPVYESYSANSLKTNSGSTTQNQRKCFYFLNYFNYCLQKGKTNGKYPNLYTYRRRINEEKIDWILSLTGIFNKLESKQGTIKFQFYKQNIDNLFWETKDIDLNDSNLTIENNLLTYTFSNKNLTFQKNSVYRVIILYTDVVGNISQSNYALIKCEDYGVNGKISIEDNNFSISSYFSPISKIKITKEFLTNDDSLTFNGLSYQPFQQLSKQSKYEAINLDKLIKKQIIYNVKPFVYEFKQDQQNIKQISFNHNLLSFNQFTPGLELKENESPSQKTDSYINFFNNLTISDEHPCLLLNGCSCSYNSIMPGFLLSEGATTYSSTKTLIIPRELFDFKKINNNYSENPVNFNFSIDQGYAFERVLDSSISNPYINLQLLGFALRPFYFNNKGDIIINPKKMEEFDWMDPNFIGAMNYQEFQNFLDQYPSGERASLLSKYYPDRVSFAIRNYLKNILYVVKSTSSGATWIENGAIPNLTSAYLKIQDDDKKDEILELYKDGTYKNQIVYLAQNDLYKFYQKDLNGKYQFENLRTGVLIPLDQINNLKILDQVLRTGITLNNIPYCFRQLSYFNHASQIPTKSSSAKYYNAQKRNSIDFTLTKDDRFIGITFYTSNVNTTNTDGEEAHLKVIDDIIQSIRIVPKEKDIFDSTFFTFPRTPINYYQYKDSFETEDLSSITVDAILANGQKLTATKNSFVSTSNSSSEFENQNTLIGFNYLKDGNNNYDEGYIKITLQKNMDAPAANIKNYNFNLYKDDKLLTIIKGSDLVGTSTSTTPIFTYYDFGCEQGKSYSYYLEPIKTDEIIYKKIKIVDVKSDFEHITLIDDEDAVSIKFNPKISTYKSNISVSKTDTLGAQYPYIRQNGDNNYKQFSLSGLISTDVKDQEAVYRNRSWHQQEIEGIDKMYEERVYKNTMLDWLNNGKPKLLKTAQEGNYIVQLMNVSLSPNDQLGRMLHTFSCEAYEVMPCTQENINKYGLFRLGFEGG